MATRLGAVASSVAAVPWCHNPRKLSQVSADKPYKRVPPSRRPGPALPGVDVIAASAHLAPRQFRAAAELRAIVDEIEALTGLKVAAA
jgi:hypothetical protein